MTLTATYHRVATGNGATQLSSPTARVTAGPPCTHTGLYRSVSSLPQIVYKKSPISGLMNTLYQRKCFT